MNAASWRGPSASGSSPSAACRCESCRAARSTARGATPCVASISRRRLIARSSWCAARAARSSWSWSTCDPDRRLKTSGSASCSARQSERLAYVPEGFAQGYQTLEDDTEVLYQMSHHYVPEAARGVRWDDPALGIELASGRGAHHLRARSRMAPPPRLMVALRSGRVRTSRRALVAQPLTDVASQDIGRSLKRGAVWAIGSQVAVQAIRLAGVVVLARLLTPADYGVAALAVTLASFSMTLGDFGFGTALVQAETASQRWASTAFWCGPRGGGGRIGTGRAGRLPGGAGSRRTGGGPPR